MIDISGATVFITGGASGIGLGMARAFAQEGAVLALVDVDTTALAVAEEELSAVTEVATFELDVRDRDAFSSIADAAEEQLGPVRVLCNNAGIGGDQTVASMCYAMWDVFIGINLGGVVNGIQTFVPRMLARGGRSHIVNTASAAGLTPGSGRQLMFTTTKYAVVGMTEVLRAQLAARGIGVTLLCPGVVATNIIANSNAALGAGHDGTVLGVPVEVLERTMAKIGMSPDAVGDLVVDAVSTDRLYVHTDRIAESSIHRRTKALLEAFPTETEHDRAVRAVVARLR